MTVHRRSVALVVKVVGAQFAWTFTYPNGKTYGQLRLPVDRSAELEITANDVIHSFWVPELGQKQDAVPGAINKLVVTPNRTGTFAVICTELCGLGHAIMRTSAIVMSATGFDEWSKRAIDAGGGGGSGALATFNSNGCGACHTFEPANSSSQVGPDLDQLPAQAEQAGKPLEEFVHESIVDPGAYLEPGYEDVMPHNFEDQIPAPKLDELVQYLVKESS